MSAEVGAEALVALLSSRPAACNPVKGKAAQQRTDHVNAAEFRSETEGEETGDTTSHVKQRSGTKRKRRKEEEAAQLAQGEPVMHELPPDGAPWANLNVTLRSGKYKGRRAVVLGLAKKKYRVQVEGLSYQLEFYPSYVGLPTPPEGYRCAPAAHNSSTEKMSQFGSSYEGSVAPPALVTVGGKQYMLMQSPQVNASGEAASAMQTVPARISSPEQSTVVVATSAERGTVNALQDTQGQMLMRSNVTRGNTVQAGDTVKLNEHPAIVPVYSMGPARSTATINPRSLLSSQFQDKYCHWVGQSLPIQRGKYQGRHARILGLTSAKLQVMVPGVEHQLEYYPSMFLDPAPKIRAIEHSSKNTSAVST